MDGSRAEYLSAENDTVEPACKFHGCKVLSVVRSIFRSSQSESAILSYNPDVRSARLYGQFSLDKTLTLQAGGTVYAVSTVTKTSFNPPVLRLICHFIEA